MEKKSNEHRAPRASIRERIANAVDISKDIILDAAVLHITGTCELIIENYKGILEYSDKCIRVRATPKCVKINGTSLEIRTITDEMLFVAGSITNVAFTEE